MSQVTVNDEVLTLLLKSVSLTKLLMLAVESEEFKAFLSTQHVLELITVAHDLPTVKSVDEVEAYQSTDVSNRLLTAVRKRNLEYVDKMIKAGADRLNYPLEIAAEKGYIEIVQYLALHLKGESDLDAAMLAAATKGQTHVTEWLRTLSKVNYENVMREAASRNNIEVVRLMLQYGATDVNTVLKIAVMLGYEEIARLMVENGATIDVDRFLLSASHQGDKKSVKLLLGLGATNVNDALVAAAATGKKGIVKLLLESGKVDKIDRALIVASQGREEIMSLLMKSELMNSLDEFTLDDAISRSKYRNMTTLLEEWKQNH